MKRLTRVTIPAALAFFVATAHPQSTKQSSPEKSDTTSSQQRQLTEQQRNQQSIFDPQRVSESELKKSVSDVNKASTFVGMSVQNLQNDKLGSVKDLVFDPESGKISYAVLSVGGFLGVGDKLVAVPISSLRPQTGEKYLVLNMTKPELTSAPGLAKDHWPKLNDPAFGSPASSEKSSGSGGSNSSSAPSSSNSSGSSDKSSSSKDDKDSSSAPADSTSSQKVSSSSVSSEKSSDQLSSPKSSTSVSPSSKDAQGSSPSSSSESSSDKATTSNSGKDSGASPSTVGESSSATSSSSK